MPKTVKAFVGLGALYVLFGAGLLAWTLVHQPPELAHLIARLPAQTRNEIFHSQLDTGLRVFALHTAIFLTLAGSAAFGRQNWARWLLLFYFLLTLLGPVIVATVQHHGVGPWLTLYLHQRWMNPALDWPVYAGTALKIALLMLIFSPNARPWFRPS